MKKIKYDNSYNKLKLHITVPANIFTICGSKNKSSISRVSGVRNESLRISSSRGISFGRLSFFNCQTNEMCKGQIERVACFRCLQRINPPFKERC